MLIPTLAGCGSTTAIPGVSGGDAYNEIITSGPVASAEEVAKSPWAQEIKKRGDLRYGGVDSVPLIAIQDLKTKTLEGFDAGIAQLLTHYITGGEDVRNMLKLTNATADTRETLIQNGTVDTVILTYSITPERAKKIAFAGPYYQSGDAIMVKAGNSDITSVDDLDGKTVATQSGSTGVAALEQFAPGAKVQQFQTDAQCVAAVQQGRVDAYVLDQAILVGEAVTNNAVKVVGQPFTQDFYGIGLPLDQPNAKEFVNAFLTKIYQDGSWAKLWKATYGTVIDGDAPMPPTTGSVDGS